MKTQSHNEISKSNYVFFFFPNNEMGIKKKKRKKNKNNTNSRTHFQFTTFGPRLPMFTSHLLQFRLQV